MSTKEIISNSFAININKQIENIEAIKREIISNYFNLIIDKQNDVEPPTIPNFGELNEFVEEYNNALKSLRIAMQKANEKIASNVFDLKTHEDIFNKLTENGKKKAIIMENGELYINATYVKSGLLEGCMIRTTEGGSGQHIHMEEGAYTAYDGTNPKGYLGFKNPVQNNQKSNIAFLALGHDGVGGTSPYIVLQDYPATYNPISLNMAYSELAYQFYSGKYSSLRWLGNGSMEANIQDYFSVGTYKSGTREELLHIKKKNGKGCIGTGRVETEYIETVGTITDTVDSKKALVMTSNNKATGVVLYADGATKSFEPIDGEAGSIYCGSAWKPWKGVYSQNSYSSQGVFINDVAKASNEEITLDNVIDNIDFVSATRCSKANYSNDLQGTLQMDVTKIKDTSFIDVDEFGNVNKNDSELIKLLILEVQKLKEKVKELETQ